MESGIVRVWWSAPTAAGAICALLDPVEQQRHARMRAPADRARFASARALTRVVLGTEMGCDPAEVTLLLRCARCGQPHGKPRAEGTTLEFSLTHAGDLVGLAVAVFPVGLDVEQHSDPDPDLVGESLADEEFAVWAALDPADRPIGFLRYWTRKEAVLKAAGVGLVSELREVIVSAPGAPAALVRAPAVVSTPMQLGDADPLAGYVAAVAAATGQPIVIEPQDGGALIAEWMRHHGGHHDDHAE